MLKALNITTIELMGFIIIFLLLLIFIISFFFLQQRRQTQNRLEKANLKAQYEREISNAKYEMQQITMHHIGHELHDNVGQMLTMVKIKLNQLAEDQPNLPVISQVKEYTSKAMADISALSKSLNNDNILGAGLATAIQFELNRIEKLNIFNTKYQQNIEETFLDGQQEIIIIRIFQELLQNILKHAQAKNVTVLLNESEKHFSLEVIDDGIGFDFEEKFKNTGFGSGSGLNNLMDRAKLLGGTLEVQSNKSGGMLSRLMISVKKTKKS